MFSDFNLPSTPNWWLRGFLAVLAIGFVGWLLDVSQVLNTENDATNLVALAILTPPAGFVDEPSCDTMNEACYQDATAAAPLDSAAAGALARSFGVAPNAITCSTRPSETCSGSGTILGSGSFTATRTDASVHFTITVGYLTTGSSTAPQLTFGTRVEFTV